MGRLHLEHLNINRHSWRHSAASADLLSQRRTMVEIKAYGRWKSDYSMRRYAKVAKMQQYAALFSPALMAYGASVMTQLPQLFAGQKLQPP